MYKILKSSDVNENTVMVQIEKNIDLDDKNGENSAEDMNNIVNTEDEISERTRLLASEEAKKIISLAYTQGEENKKSLIRQAYSDIAVLEKNKLREAEEKGFTRGIQNAENQINDFFENVSKLIEDMNGNFNQFKEELEEDLGLLSITVAEQVLQTEIEKNQLILKPLIQKAIEHHKAKDEIVISVSKNMNVLIDDLKSEISKNNFSFPYGIDVESKNIDNNSVMVGTKQGITDASISTQLENLKTLFEKSIT